MDERPRRLERVPEEGPAPLRVSVAFLLLAAVAGGAYLYSVGHARSGLLIITGALVVGALAFLEALGGPRPQPAERLRLLHFGVALGILVTAGVASVAWAASLRFTGSVDDIVVIGSGMAVTWGLVIHLVGRWWE